MTGIALVFLVIAVVIIWGGLVVSTVLLSRRPEVTAYPPGGDEVEAQDHSGRA
ncbi:MULTISPECIES: methionine/alanine import family NSS transporter small subunit [Microbacterium]|uniref:methionine/alanine import family NSS transporter small subunit n=1 Tax=Microbacterium TaxID=33882 RepID=UPI00217E13E1|nr:MULTISPECIES: methionine/alanine import family NSS transporter small subunit [Microbacterium]UWF76810.1 methionine/alanine import family NSS transporter small subunit [Microbacterium neungamense]WCM54960.1 methionine/alanine import family NSS transporter small subunit [Microbacterium sp. EF45047]